MLKVPLLSLHEKTAAELGEFAGWQTVITFTSVREEHHAVRNKAAVFDISHMTRTKITGPGATALLQNLLTVDVEKLKPNRMKYGLLLNESGGIIDDVTVFKIEADNFFVVSNAVTRQKVLSWLRAHASNDVSVEDLTDFSAFFAVQGPEAHVYVSDLVGDVSGFKWFEGGLRSFNGCWLLVTRSGYTGGDGFEMMVPCGGMEVFEKIWTRLVEKGVTPAGLACRDVCRIEAGYPLYGQDFDESNDPYEAGLSWAVKTEKPFFIGKESLAQRSRPLKTLAMVEMVDPGIPRRGYKIYHENEEIGLVSSGCFSPTAGKGIALAHIRPELLTEGREILLDVRGRLRRAVVRTKPWVSLTRS
ncbi:MAG: glycine cleavage system aminomethyltransferase GcvT [Candidatus Caldarchaeum sp.]|nr:glycine cleavage system aminomethyltransferase GcvT [Candidatus Caldarchaeum sp.]